MILGEQEIKDYLSRVDVSKAITINDLENKDFAGKKLESEEVTALQKFRKARIKKLKTQRRKEFDFHFTYEYYRALSNLVDYRDILAEKIPF